MKSHIIRGLLVVGIGCSMFAGGQAVAGEQSTITIPAEAFRPYNTVTGNLYELTAEAVMIGTAAPKNPVGLVVAPLYLPQGAKLLTASAVFLRTEDGVLQSEQGAFVTTVRRAVRQPSSIPAGAEYESIFQFVVMKTVAEFQKKGFIQQTVPIEGGFETVNNRVYQYRVFSELTAGLGLRGIRIDYELPSPVVTK